MKSDEHTTVNLKQLRPVPPAWIGSPSSGESCQKKARRSDLPAAVALLTVPMVATNFGQALEKLGRQRDRDQRQADTERTFDHAAEEKDRHETDIGQRRQAEDRLCQHRRVTAGADPPR